MTLSFHAKHLPPDQSSSAVSTRLVLLQEISILGIEVIVYQSLYYWVFKLLHYKVSFLEKVFLKLLLY